MDNGTLRHGIMMTSLIAKMLLMNFLAVSDTLLK